MNVQMPSDNQVNNNPDLHTRSVCSSQEYIMKDKERNLLLRPCFAWEQQLLFYEPHLALALQGVSASFALREYP